MRAIFTVACLGLMLFVLGADAPATAPAPKETLTINLGGGVSLEMVLIDSGTFLMGSQKGEDDEKPAHEVTLTKPFYLGKFEVTQEQWQAVMSANPSEFKGPKNPVENVNWDDCQVFLQKLAEKVPGKTFKLPTEAQWEYACRAGSVTEYAHGDAVAALGDYAWYHANSSEKTHPVGQKRPNAWGLYDMHGNVCEWCADWYSSGYSHGGAAVASPTPLTDPTGSSYGDARVIRGESWVSPPADLRSAYRVGTPVGYRNSHVGLRVLCLPAQVPQ